jgi:non-ribosomal peptide synthetase component F
VALAAALIVLIVGLSLLWWRLDRSLRSRIARVREQRAIEAIEIPPTPGGAYRTGGAIRVRVDRTAEVLARLERRRQIVRYAIAVPLAAVVLVLAIITEDGLELVADLWPWFAERDRRWS